MPVTYRRKQHSRRRARSAEFARPRKLASRPLAAAISALLLGGAVQAQAQSFPPVLQLADLDGTNGFRLDGVAAFDRSGRSVSGAGDFNGDGINDFVLGADGADTDGDNSGSSYVVFGQSSGFPAALALSSLDGSNGFRIDGAAAYDASGRSVSGAGDLNGDGFDDVVIGARYADPNGSNSGSSYVVFGQSSGFPETIELASLDGNTGFRLDGVNAGDRSGIAVSGAGDVNGDGIDDVVIGATEADPNGLASGSSYVVFGRSSGFAATLNLASLDGNNGFRIDGVAEVDRSGRHVSKAGDVNDDGFDDVLISTDAGSSYVVFGQSQSFSAVVALSSLDGSNGFRLDRDVMASDPGGAISNAGDINGDGIDDLLLGAYGASSNGSYSGSSYVVFGQTSDFPAAVALSSLDGSNGFRLDGAAQQDLSGGAVSAAGDVNADGIDDLLIGAVGAGSAGASYVVFGQLTGFPATMPLASLDGNNGFRLDGEPQFGGSGAALSGTEDVNGDGIDDIIVGAYRADPNGIFSGRSYVVFGRGGIDLSISKSNGIGFVAANEAVTYFIDVVNLSALDVLDALLIDNLPPTLDAGTASWTCTGSAGAVCPNASGSGNISETIDLPGGGMLNYELTATVLATEGMTVTNTATVTLPAELSDINPADNSASDSDPVGVFADGFEDP